MAGGADSCAPRGLTPLPATPATVAAFLASEADREFRPVTITRRAAAIAAAHRAQDHPNPCDSGAVAAVLSGIRHQHGTRALRTAAPLELDPAGPRLLEPIDPATLAGLRDRALLRLGLAAALRRCGAAALRRSELVALDVEDLAFDASRGLLVTIRRSKTDQERAGATRCGAVRARGKRHVRGARALGVAADRRDPHRGPVFRQMRRGDTLTDRRLSDQSVALIVKRRAAAAGVRPEELSGHSLRAGYTTTVSAAGAEERKIANVTRHKNLPVLRRYMGQRYLSPGATFLNADPRRTRSGLVGPASESKRARAGRKLAGGVAAELIADGVGHGRG